MTFRVVDSTQEFTNRDWKLTVAAFIDGSTRQFRSWPFKTHAELFATIRGFHVQFDETLTPRFTHNAAGERFSAAARERPERSTWRPSLWSGCASSARRRHSTRTLWCRTPSGRSSRPSCSGRAKRTSLHSAHCDRLAMRAASPARAAVGVRAGPRNSPAARSDGLGRSV